MSSNPLPPDNSRAAQPGAATDNDLLSAIVRQDQAAMLGLYDRYSVLACSIAVHVLDDMALAEEVVQDVFLQLWRSPLAFDPARGSFRAWITVVVRHRAIDFLRKKAVDPPLPENVPTGARSQEAVAISQQLIKIVKRVIAKLPQPHQEIFVMAYFQGFTHVEITQKTGLPLGTVKSRLRSMLEEVRRSMTNDSGPRLINPRTTQKEDGLRS